MAEVPVAKWEDQTVEMDMRPKAGGEVVIFYTRQVKNEFESKRQDRPVFFEKVYCKILTGGDNLHVHDQPVREIDREKYALQWERWQKTRENKIPGMPIESWHGISDTQKAEFRALNIFTVEQFANLPDSAANKIMGFHDLRRRAQVFVEAGKDAELLGRIRAEAEEKLKGQQAQIDALMAKLQELTAQQNKPKQRPGRKPGWNKKPAAAVPVPVEG